MLKLVQFSAMFWLPDDVAFCVIVIVLAFVLIEALPAVTVPPSGRVVASIAYTFPMYAIVNAAIARAAARLFQALRIFLTIKLTSFLF